MNDHVSSQDHNCISGLRTQLDSAVLYTGPKGRAWIWTQIMNHNLGPTRWARTVRSKRVWPKLWFNMWAPLLEP